MTTDPYKRLAEHLDALPNGYPATEDGIELRLLQKLFTPEEADLAAQLRLTFETPAQIAARIGGDPRELRDLLKTMVRKGLIAAGRAEGGLGFRSWPFAIGIYEMQAGRMDAELAGLFEEYYHRAFGRVLGIHPQVHRVIPIEQSVQVDMEVRPFESAAEIVASARAWGVLDCICRTQKALVGDPCDHPMDVCMSLSQTPGMFDRSTTIRALTQEEAMDTLRRAAEAGLVHTVSNNQEGHWYICNCCTCSCGILRGMADLGMANVIARSAFVNTVDEDLCIGCGECIEHCQFDALTLGDIIQIDEIRCTGCGVCVPQCPQDALVLVRRPDADVELVPVTEEEWREKRAQARGVDIRKVL